MITTESIKPFLDQVVQWAGSQADIWAVLLVGSYARQAAKDTSDIDLVLLSDDPAQFLKDTRWSGQFGQVERQQMEDYGLLVSLRVWYRGGSEVEFGISSPAWASLPMDAGTKEVLEDGYLLLYERTPWLSEVLNKIK